MKDIKNIKNIKDIKKGTRPDIGRIIEPDHNIDPALREEIASVSKTGSLDKLHAEKAFEKSQREGVLVEERNEEPSLAIPTHPRPTRKQQKD